MTISDALPGEGAQDLDLLAVGGAERRHDATRHRREIVEPGLVARSLRTARACHGGPPCQRRPGSMPRMHVLRDRPPRLERRLLGDDRDALRQRVGGTSQARRTRSRRPELALVRSMRPRRGSCPRVDLPAPFSPTSAWTVPRSDVQVDAAQRLDRCRNRFDDRH